MAIGGILARNTDGTVTQTGPGTAGQVLTSNGAGAVPTFQDNGAAVADATFLTATDETADLPNSRQLVAGTHVTFDDTTPGQRTINVSASAVDYVVLSNGVQPPTAVDDGAGHFIYVGYTP